MARKRRRRHFVVPEIDVSQILSHATDSPRYTVCVVDMPIRIVRVTTCTRGVREAKRKDKLEWLEAQSIIFFLRYIHDSKSIH